MTTPTPSLPDLLRAAADWIDPDKTVLQFEEKFPWDEKRGSYAPTLRDLCRAAADRLEAEQPAPDSGELQRLRDELTKAQQRENEGVALFDKLLAEERAMVAQLRAENERMRQDLAKPRPVGFAKITDTTERDAARAETQLWRDRAEWLLGEMRKEADRG